MTLPFESSNTSGYAKALQAAREAVGPQLHPPSTLYVVATPIGNLADITLRALYVIEKVDTVACEDTRHTQQLLRAYGLDRPSAQLLAVHQHNEAQAAEQVIARLAQGQRVAYVSDAGTPCISDPGARLAAAVAAAGFRVMPLPGASSVTAVLSAAGAQGDGEFVFAGFLPSKASERSAAVQALTVLGARRVTVGRELTKQFETLHTLEAQNFAHWLSGKPERVRGEFALVLHALDKASAQDASGVDAQSLRTLQLLLAELPLKSAVKLAAEISGTPRNKLYDAALLLKKGLD